MIRAGLALLLAACAGSNPAPRVVATSTPPDAAPPAEPDARAPTACEIYQTSVGPSLGRIEGALIRFMEAPTLDARREAANAAADEIERSRQSLAFVKTGTLALDSANLRMVDALAPLAGAIRNWAYARVQPEAERALTDYKQALAVFASEIEAIRSACPALE